MPYMNLRETFTNRKEKNLLQAKVTTQIKPWNNVWQKTRTIWSLKKQVWNTYTTGELDN